MWPRAGLTQGSEGGLHLPPPICGSERFLSIPGTQQPFLLTADDGDEEAEVPISGEAPPPRLPSSGPPVRPLSARPPLTPCRFCLLWAFAVPGADWSPPCPDTSQQPQPGKLVWLALNKSRGRAPLGGLFSCPSLPAQCLRRQESSPPWSALPPPGDRRVG